MRSSILHRFAHLVCASAVAVPSLVFLSANADAAGTQTAGSVLSAAKSAIASQVSVHLVLTSSSRSTSAVERLQADLAKNRGTESISQGTGVVEIRITPAFGYIRGNASGLKTVFGMTAAQVKKVGKDWLAVKVGSSQYKALATSMTMSSVPSVLPPATGTRLYTPAGVGKRLYTLKWNTKATSTQPALASTLTISASGARLPVRETTTALGRGQQTVVLSKWGERVVVSAPPASSTIPLSKVTG
jgi:hypothetical protein